MFLFKNKMSLTNNLADMLKDILKTDLNMKCDNQVDEYDNG